MTAHAAKQRRRLAAGGLARIQSEFGEGSLFRIEKREGPIPAGQYRCRPVPADRVLAGAPTGAVRPPPGAPPAVVRRIYDEPQALRRRKGGNWLLREMERGAVRVAAGPWRTSGTWWRRLAGRPTGRDYYFASLPTGEVRWVFHDRERRGWFLEGRVE